MRPFLHLSFIALCMLSLSPAVVQAQSDAPKLRMPVACELGKSCWLVNYPDTDAAHDVARDYQCGPLTYEGHDGSDFAIRDLVALETGVPVLAAADGKVLRLRDGSEDRMPSKEDIDTLLREKKACGNGMMIEHAGGWQTLYCHMKQGSLTVKEGQQVKAGTQLGLVGHSGAAEFPHLHFTLMKQGKIYDPFSAQIMGNTACKAQGTSLWKTPLPYESVSLYAAGFKSSIPDLDGLRIDATPATTLRQGETRILTFWAVMYGAASGDRITLEIMNPAGETIAQREITQSTTRARQFYFIGKDFKDAAAPVGTYTGVITLSRRDADGKTLIRTRDATVTVQ